VTSPGCRWEIVAFDHAECDSSWLSAKPVQRPRRAAGKPGRGGSVDRCRRFTTKSGPKTFLSPTWTSLAGSATDKSQTPALPSSHQTGTGSRCFLGSGLDAALFSRIHEVASRCANPLARAARRSTAARTEVSDPTTRTLCFARVTAV